MPGRAGDGGGDDLDQATARPSASSGAEQAPPTASRARRGARWWLFGGLAGTIAVADQLTKAWIVGNVDPLRPTVIVGDLLRLVLSHNTGGLFGMFRDQAGIFALLSLGVIGIIVWYHGHVGRSPLASIALGLLLGGALGNLVDRLHYGDVVDFVDAGVGGLRWYTFNVADAAISTALVLLVLLAIWPTLAGEAGDATDADA